MNRRLKQTNKQTAFMNSYPNFEELLSGHQIMKQFYFQELRSMAISLHLQVMMVPFVCGP